MNIEATNKLMELVPGLEYGMTMDDALEVILREIMRLRAEQGLDNPPKSGAV